METTAKQLETLKTAAGCLRAKQAGSGYQDTKLQRQLKATSTECAFSAHLNSGLHTAEKEQPAHMF